MRYIIFLPLENVFFLGKVVSEMKSVNHQPAFPKNPNLTFLSQLWSLDHRTGKNSISKSSQIIVSHFSRFGYCRKVKREMSLGVLRHSFQETTGF
jgi:hypothetical protein